MSIIEENKEFSKIISNIFNIDERCVKVWRTDKMNINDVLIGINFVKSIGQNTIIYNTIVPFKERLSEEQGITILDGDDLILKCFSNNELLKFEGLIKYN